MKRIFQVFELNKFKIASLFAVAYLGIVNFILFYPENIWMQLLWYCIATIIFCYQCWNDKLCWNMVWSLVIIVMLITGGANYILIGNYAFRQFCFSIMSILIAKFFLDNHISTSLIKYLLYSQIGIVTLIICNRGIWENVFSDRTSNNYISVFLLMTMVVYYFFTERQNEKISVLPSLLVFILSILSQSRGGILTTGIFFAGLLIYKNFCCYNLPKLLKTFILLFGVFGIVYFGIYIMNNDIVYKYDVFEHFARSGTNSVGRMLIWTEYWDSTFDNWLNFFGGAPFEGLPFVTWYRNNLHNSFFEIHGYNGMITFLLVIFACLYNLFYGIKHKKWIFLLCFIVLCMRGATDKMLWAHSYMPIFLMLLLYPLTANNKNKVLDEGYIDEN